MTDQACQTRARNSAQTPLPAGGYAQAVEVEGARRLLFVSGQIPVDLDGRTPPDFDSQCRLVWRNVVAQLEAAGMNLDDVIKVTTYLSDRRYGEANGAVRRDVLGSRKPALTVVIAGIFDEDWLLEIEAIAAR